MEREPTVLGLVMMFYHSARMARKSNHLWSLPSLRNLTEPVSNSMMNIVRASGHKTVNHWYNAVLIATKYNMTTEYLVTQSVECQNKYHGFGYDPYRNG